MEFVIDKGLSDGVRRDSRQQRNSQPLTSLLNLIPTEYGLKAIPAVNYPLSSPTLTMSWPHPQILDGDYFKVLANKTTLHEIDTSALTGSAISFVDSATLSTSGNIWELASFQEDVWFMTNVTNFVYRIPSNDSADADIEKAVTVNTVANHNGRLVLGGLGGTLPNTLTDFFDEWVELDHSVSATVGENTSLGGNWIVFSDPGGGARDQPFRAFMEMFEFPLAPSDDMIVVIRDAIESGEMGFFPLKRSGNIIRILPLGGDLMVYTESGVSRLRWTEGGYVEQALLEFGVTARGCVGGNDQEHVFLTAQSDLYRATRGGDIERLNYREFMDTLTVSSTVICFDPDEGYYTISDNNNGFTLTRTGLGATDAVLPSSLARLQGYDGLVGTAVNAADPQAVSLLTEIFDGGDRGVWELQYVSIATTDTTTAGWKVQVDWRLNKNDAWTRTTAQVVDDRGKALVKVSGIEFRVYLTATDRTKVDLERIEATLRKGGKRKLKAIS